MLCVEGILSQPLLYLSLYLKQHRDRIQAMGRISGSALRVHQALQERAVDNPTRIAERSGLSLPTVNSALASLAEAGIVREKTGRRRGRIFSYVHHLRILSEGTEPLP